MSNNLVSQQMSIQNIQMGQLEPLSNKLDSSIHMGMMGQGVNSPALQQMSMSDMQMGMMGPNSTDASSQQISVSSHQTQPYEYMPNNHVLQKLSVSNMQMGPRSYNLVSDILPPNKQPGGMETMFNTVGQQSSVLIKRKMPMDSNKRVAHVEHRPWLHQASSPNKLSVQMQSQSTSTASGSPRPQAQFKRSASTKAGPQQLSAQKNPSGQPSPKYQNESTESVRLKLRESLGAALALVCQEQDKSSSVGKQSQNTGTQVNSQTSGLASGTACSAFNHVIEENKESLSDKGYDTCTQNKGGLNSTPKISSNNSDDYTETSRIHGQNCQSVISSLGESVSVSDGLFVKDELLQGNGLSWVLESNMGLEEKREAQIVEKQPAMGDSCIVSGGRHTQPPEVLASKIEVELYKLYSGVNKKYKEKGRSLLFNLKDRNNPDLREKVMSGDIAPDRLCAMTAEELASKELSEWRTAKAEELAQMVVLPDSDGDMRRLVKKTHKGEFQVEVEPHDSISVEVATAPSSLTRMRPKPREKDDSSPSQPDKKKIRGNGTGQKSSPEDQNVLMIPSTDGSDLMQGLMVDDELKDAEFLPPIVSLDEFMESLNAEPPFENLPVDAGKATTVSDKDDSRVGSESKSPDDVTSGKPGTVDLTNAKLDSDGKSAEELIKSETPRSVSITKGELVWEGLLQLNISSSASVMALFKSGEKAFAKAWPGLVEIKGRVRLDAFEKFLQELPMSRSRAVMAVQFVCKEGSAESERASVKEVADSYVVDCRVGFAEPASGVELYVCPPDSKTREMLGKVLPKDQLDALNFIDNGLIGVIVWRKPHITSTISPNHKHNSKKQNSTSRTNLEKDANLDVNVMSKHHGDRPHSFVKPQPDENDGDDDDVPPGFGPSAGAARDEDDLPEFNFSSGPLTPRSHLVKKSGIQGQGMPFHSPQSLPRPVDQMRELVHKYGQPETNNARGVMVQTWNDDDDDMPEWHPDDAKSQPQLQPQPHLQPAHVQAVFMRNNSIQQPMLRAHVMQQTQYQHMAPQTQTISSQPQVNVMQPPQTPWQQQGQWMAPISSYQNNNGQPWRRDAPSSRGF
ncbi:uncharacterized protein [Euphorbia lathyris]|uniref:uncharacterized protein n=1 Tax=Euphorbia lathyris TaxID=212925 RepID=UPI003313CD16